jgi:type VI secretion system secreted protein VgrG
LTLGSASDFSVLGGVSVTNTGLTTLSGNLGISPGSTLTGFGPGVVLGSTHLNDAAAITAQSDAATAYGALAAMSFDQNLTGQNLGGLTLSAGVYRYSSSALLNGVLTLD